MITYKSNYTERFQTMQHYRVVLLEDDLFSDDIIVKSFLKSEIDIHYSRVSNFNELQDLLFSNKVDAVLSSFNFPNIDKNHALNIVKQYSKSVLFIILSDTGAEDLTIQLMKSGAQDYALKNHLERLVPSIDFHLKKLAERFEIDENSYRILAENAIDMITRHDENGIYNYVSNSSYNLLGYNPIDLLGKSAYDFLHPEDAEQIKQGLMEFISNGLGIYTASYRYRKKDGSYIWIESTNKLAFIDHTNQFLGIISISRDISERKAFQSRLEEKIKELDTFIYRSSHDLKGPLASLQGLLNVAKTEIIDEKAIKYFKLIEKSVLNLDTILMDLLNITKITQGTLENVDVNVKEVITNIISSFENLPEYSAINWDLHFDELEVIKIDKSLLNNIFQNLIINAIKYQDKKKESEYIKITTKVKSNQMIITVEDNGEGISDRLQAHVFDMFFRGNTKSSGSGLGLYIVKNAVEKTGGRIELKSNEGIGTIFTIYLPINNTVQNAMPFMIKKSLS